MRKTPGKDGEEEEKFGAYVPTVELGGEGEATEQIAPVIMPLSGLPQGPEQARDREDDD